MYNDYGEGKVESEAHHLTLIRSCSQNSEGQTQENLGVPSFYPVWLSSLATLWRDDGAMISFTFGVSEW